jgi:hypothetical protein
MRDRLNIEEQAWLTSRRVLEAGTIKFGAGAINCMIRNISDAGAMLDVTKPAEVPEQFTLAWKQRVLRRIRSLTRAPEL